MEKIIEELKKDLGERVFKASEAPPVKVISTGITSLDVATGVGGWPRGVLVEVFGRESVGKTALSLHTITEVHKNNGFAALVNLESSITQEGWLNWATSIAPPGFDPERLLIVNAKPGTESVTVFGKLIASGGLDVVVYDSIGAMSTDKELQIGESKQAFGQSAQVTQLVKQAAHYCYDNECVALLLNQVRDDAAGQYIMEKAPGGHAKDHLASLRVHLRQSWRDAPVGKVDGDNEKLGFRVNAVIKKNKVGAPRRRAGWNYWDFPSPSGVIGIDTFQDTVDTALRMGLFERRGAWYYHEDFPDGKLNGGVAVTNFLRDNAEVMEATRRALVMESYKTDGNVMEDREVLVDAG